MKYIIDISDEAIELMGGQISIFVEPVFKTGECKHYALRLSKEDIEPYTEPDREAIEDEVWRFCMNTDWSYQEAQARYEEWKRQKDEIRVGDEVIPMDTQYDTMIVTRTWKDDYWREYIDTVGFDGSICSFLQGNVKKTGRHFDEIEELLKKMRGEARNDRE